MEGKKVLVLDPNDFTTKNKHWGGIYQEDAVILNNLSKDKDFGLEIGSYTGLSTVILARNLKKLISIDNFKGDGSNLEKEFIENDIYKQLIKNLKKYGVEEKVKVLKGNSDDFVDDVKDSSLDIVFIDGDHRFSQVDRDINNYRKKVKKGGILCGHDFEDFTWDERYVEKDFIHAQHHGVCKAVSKIVGVEKADKGRMWWVKC